ncbi:MAG: response regulator [Nitrospirota bacterium]
MAKTKILCIDDTPDQIIDTSVNTTLKQILEGIYKLTPYEVVFETLGEEGIDAAKKDNNIKLVLLDIEFTRQKKQGDEIAKDLIKNRPELKVIVLTRVTKTGTKISLGHKRNVIHYVVKKELSSTDTQGKLKNLSRAVIEDCENKGWHLEYDGMETITLSMGEKSFGINIPITAKQAIQDCISSPNRPVSVALASDQLNKAHNMINNNAREGTDWNTWGILTKESCAKGQLKLVIGSVVPLSDPRIPKNPYVTKSQFEKFKKDIEERLDLIEKALNFKSPQKNK